MEGSTRLKSSWLEGSFPQKLQLIRPGARLAGRAADRLAHAAHLVYGVLLHHVEELKGHGERLRAPRREAVRLGAGGTGEGLSTSLASWPSRWW